MKIFNYLLALVMLAVSVASCSQIGVQEVSTSAVCPVADEDQMVLMHCDYDTAESGDAFLNVAASESYSPIKAENLNENNVFDRCYKPARATQDATINCESELNLVVFSHPVTCQCVTLRKKR